jgi:hypothetical protein
MHHFNHKLTFINYIFVNSVKIKNNKKLSFSFRPFQPGKKQKQ